MAFSLVYHDLDRSGRAHTCLSLQLTDLVGCGSRAKVLNLQEVPCPRSSTAPEGSSKTRGSWSRSHKAAPSTAARTDQIRAWRGPKSTEMPHERSTSGVASADQLDGCNHESCNLDCEGTPWRGGPMVPDAHRHQEPQKADLSISTLKSVWGFQ